MAGTYTVSVLLTDTGALIGSRSITVKPAPLDTAASPLSSPPANSIITAGDSLSARVQPRDRYNNAAAPAAGQQLVVIARYDVIAPRAAGAPPVANGARSVMTAVAGGAAYGPLTVSYVAQAAGNVTLRVVLEAIADSAPLAELPSIAIAVRHAPSARPWCSASYRVVRSWQQHIRAALHLSQSFAVQNPTADHLVSTRIQPKLQVMPAAAAPDASSLALSAPSITAARANLRLRLALADSYGNLLTAPSHVAASAAISFTTRQRTVQSIADDITPENLTLPIVPSSVLINDAIADAATGTGTPEPAAATPPPPAASAVAERLTAVAFEGSGSSIALAWNVTLTRAGVHELSALLGPIRVTGAPVNVTVAAAALAPAACRVAGPNIAGSHSMVAGNILPLRLRAADEFQNAIPEPAGGAAAAAQAEALLVNWAEGLPLGAFADPSGLSADSGSHGALSGQVVLCSHVRAWRSALDLRRVRASEGCALSVAQPLQ